MTNLCDRKFAVNSTKWKTRYIVLTAVAFSLFLFLTVNTEKVLAGLACASNPCLFGVCIDDVNDTFLCYCIDGYTGFLCQTNWDECWSNPCLNGAECVDGIAHFNCTCPPGYQGELCETDIDECSSNPCHNNGTCIDGKNGYSCICPAGYLGDFCETDISVCNDTNEMRCMNGGLCIEGPGFTFNCVCQPGWTGKLCNIEVDECASSPCRNGGLCLDMHANYSCACTFGYTGKSCEIELEMCGESSPCQNGALCLIEDWLSVCYCVPDFHGDRCQYQYDECQLGPGCKNGGTCIDGVDGYTCSCPPDLTGSLCECLILGTGELDCKYVAPATSTLPSSTIIEQTVPIWIETEVPKTPFYRNVSSTKDYSPTSQSTVSFTKLFPFTIREATTTRIYKKPFSTEKATVTFTSFTQNAATPTKEPTKITTEMESIPYTDYADLHTLKDQASSTRDINLKTTASTTELALTEKTSTIKLTTSKPIITTAVSIPITTLIDESIYVPFTKLISAAPKATRFPPTTESFPTTSTQINLSSTPQSSFNCIRSPCLNGGMCLNTTSGPKCICKPDWQGDFCEEKADFKTAAFSGKSYLSHHLNNTSKLRIDLTARTVSPTGIILQTHLGPDIYMTLYLDENLLKFKFSCGLQTMLLSEVQLRINNGFDFIGSVALEFLPKMQNKRQCLATVRINNTLAMSGEQAAAEPRSDLGNAFLHIGGVPKMAPEKDLPVTEGFIGCIGDLMINEVRKNIFKDAFDTNEVSECKSLACLSNPCHSGSSCIEYNGTWSCICPSGYVGSLCERSVCKNNPCEYGGTCAPFPGSGFICLCPLGKRGLFCEKDVDITHPVFSSSTGGLSSFTAYMLPTEIHEDIIIGFKFTPHDMEQISLMLFIGQDGYHGPTSDHLAVSFIKGYVVLTWNLGSGPRRIFTTQPISDTGNIFHNVKVGRVGQRAWLTVDNQRNVTGRSPGKLSQLNARSLVYVGGHDSVNFSFLPHDLPLHTGFSGCLFDVEIKTNQRMIKLEKTLASFSRGVGQCGTTLCHEKACDNGGGCIYHGATYTCLCSEGWFGPTCNQRYNPCDSARHKCTQGSTCVPLKQGYSCDCPPGKTGDFCEISEEISDVKLKGVRSFIMLSANGLYQQQSCIDLEVRPLDSKGLLLYSGRSDGSGFWSLSIQGGVLELRVSPGKHRRRGDFLVIKSRRFLTIGRWHRIRAGRYGRRLFLWVEGTVNTGVLLPGENLPPSGTLIYIGGVPDMSMLPYGVMAGNLINFHGCVRKFASQWKMVPLNKTNILDGRNVEDCDGTVCGGDVCNHGGTCFIDSNNRPICSCIQQYTGDKCEIQVSCKETNCQNGGRCTQEKDLLPKCYCPIGWGGPHCESALSVEPPHFGGNSYILIDRSNTGTKRRDITTKYEVDFVYINFTTAAVNGMILWSSRENRSEFFGIGVEDSKLKVIWAWEGQNKTSIVISKDGVADGSWHDMALSFDLSNVTIWTDHHIIYNLDCNYPNRSLTTDGLFFLGGFPEDKSVHDVTGGHFSSGFIGCIKKIGWSLDTIIVNFSDFEGENIGTCDPLEPYLS